MGLEIERKFLLRHDGWRQLAAQARRFCQAYLDTGHQSRCSVRVRIEGDVARLNIKSVSVGMSRAEFEVPLSIIEAEAMLRELCVRPFITKIRHLVEYGGHTWEIDEFEGQNTGLIVAEIELESEDEAFARPDWLGEEVTRDPRYYNTSLVRQPYANWGKTTAGVAADR